MPNTLNKQFLSHVKSSNGSMINHVVNAACIGAIVNGMLGFIIGLQAGKVGAFVGLVLGSLLGAIFLGVLLLYLDMNSNTSFRKWLKQRKLDLTGYVENNLFRRKSLSVKQKEK